MSSKPKYTVAICGTGKRSKIHAEAFLASGRFDIVAVCGRDLDRVAIAAASWGNTAKYQEPAEMLRDTKPDVFCFCTPPSIRMPLIKVGVEHGVKLIAYEKPMATSFEEALKITDLCRSAGIKTVVSHQTKYGSHFQKVNEIVRSGSLGRLQMAYGTTLGWLLQMGPHVIDSCRYFLGEPEAEWVFGQASGTEKLADSHPSPDFMLGEVHFANGVRGILEFGSLAQDVPEVEYFWHKARIGVQGTTGFAEVLVGGGWRATTRDHGFVSGPGCWNAQSDQLLYVEGIALWLDDANCVHPCNGENAFKGFEILMGICRSAIERHKITLPLAPGLLEMASLTKILR